MTEIKQPSLTATTVPLTDEQREYFSDKSVRSFEVMAEAAKYLENLSVDVLVTVVSIKVPDSEGRKIVVLANPSMPPDMVKALLELIGRESEFSVQQTQAIIGMATEKSAKARQETCAECSESEECEACKPVKETVH
jgi:hypothetical protein